MVDYCESTLGQTLKECRMMSQLTLNEAATATALPLTRLLEIESGKSGPTTDILRNLMRIYGPALREIHASTGEERRTASPDRSEIDWISLMVRADAMSNRQLLEYVATAVRTLRKLGPTVSVHMRSPEADLLVSMLDLSDKDLAADIVNEFGLSISQVKEFIAGAVNRASRRSNGGDSEYLRRLRGLEYPADLADVR